MVHDKDSITSDSGCDVTTASASCCSADNPCYVDEGDCDSDSDCMAGLSCGDNNCPEGFPAEHDCCTGYAGYADVFRITNRRTNSGCDLTTYLDSGCTGNKRAFIKIGPFHAV